MSTRRNPLLPLALALFALGPGQAAPPPTLLTPGSAAPDFTAKLGAKRSVRFSEIAKGKALVLTFVALSSDFCRWQLLQLQKERQRFGAAGLEVVAISSGKRDGLQQLQRYQEANGLSFSIFPAAVSQEDPPRLYHVRTFPTTYLIGKDGKILDAWVGYPQRTGAADLERRLAQAGFKG